MNLFSKISDLLLGKSSEMNDDTNSLPEIRNEDILDELKDCFEKSLLDESVGSSLLFNAHYLIILHPDTLDKRFKAFPVIFKEAIKAFELRLSQLKTGEMEITPVANRWEMKFASGESNFNGEKIELHDISVAGMLVGPKKFDSSQEPTIEIGEDDNPNLQQLPPISKTVITIKSKKTGRFEKLEINQESFKNIKMNGDLEFEAEFGFKKSLTINESFNKGVKDKKEGMTGLPRSKGSSLATIEFVLEDNESGFRYEMRVSEIVIARKEDKNLKYSNYLLIDSTYVSDPHARIRYLEDRRQFQIASFSRNETRVNEKIIPRSEITNPTFFDIPSSSKILLNGLITLSFNGNY